jgi:hypothetical protein
MSSRFIVVFLATAVLLPLVATPRSEAQARVGAGVSVHPGASGGERSFGISVGRTPGMQRVHRPTIFLGGPYFYSDYPSEPALQEASPQVVVVQPPVTAEPAKEAAPEPLMIEWQGDHYARLRVAQAGTTNAKPVQLDYVETRAKPALTLTRSALAQAGNVAAAAPALPPVVLIYRDGHREEIRDYTIADGTIYARGDYWTDGYRNKKIHLAALDLPATTRASQENGVKFDLPASPNEVVTRF